MPSRTPEEWAALNASFLAPDGKISIDEFEIQQRITDFAECVRKEALAEGYRAALDDFQFWETGRLPGELGNQHSEQARKYAEENA